MKFFIASSLCWNYQPRDCLTIAKEHGLAGVELWAEHIYYHDADPSELRELAKKNELQLTLHASSWDLNICSLNKGIQEQSIKELKKSIQLAKKLDVLHMTFHPGRFTVKSYLQEEHERALIENTKVLIQEANEQGVVLSQELMEPIPKEMLTTPEAMNEFLDAVGEGLYVTLDIAHTPLDESNINYLQQLKRVNSIHLSDSSKQQYHVPLGEGDVNVDEVLHALSKHSFPIVLEGIDMTEELHFLNKHLQYLTEHEWLERKTST